MTDNYILFRAEQTAAVRREKGRGNTMLFSITAAVLAAMNLAAMAAMARDKHAAQRGAERIPEATLLSLAVLGGGAGALLGMLLWRHKTRKIAFALGLPLVFLCQLGLGYFLYSLA